MNPEHNEQGGLNLPAPSGEILPLPPLPGEASNQTPEMSPAAPEQAAANQPPAAQPAATDQTTASQVVPVSVPQTDVPVTTTSSQVSALDDHDLIEKEWVTKAKQIVERTREDPHQQSKELTVFKADYMQQHYNKTIKVDE